jgi:hypothetical protein
VVTVLSDRGAPTPVAWTRLRAPRSLMAQLDPAVQAQAVAGSALLAKYGTPIDRDSAYEKLTAKLAAAHPEPQAEPPHADPAPAGKPASPPKQEHHDGGVVAEVLGSSAFKSFARSTATVLGREITRSLFGTARRRRR